MPDMDPVMSRLLGEQLAIIEKQYGMHLVLVWEDGDGYGVVARSCPVCCAELLYRVADQLAWDGGSCGKHATRRE